MHLLPEVLKNNSMSCPGFTLLTAATELSNKKIQSPAFGYKPLTCPHHKGLMGHPSNDLIGTSKFRSAGWGASGCYYICCRGLATEEKNKPPGVSHSRQIAFSCGRH